MDAPKNLKNRARRTQAINPVTDEARQFAIEAARIVDEIKIENIVILHIGPQSDFTDYFVIASCLTRTQMRAATQKIADLAKARGQSRLGLEGETSEQWRLLDYGDVIVHLFNPETRAYYRLERLWGDAGSVQWRPEAQSAPSRT